jgi:hypothetical protein
MMRFLMISVLAIVPAFSQTLTVVPPASVVAPGTSGTVQIMLATPATGTQPVVLQFTVGGTGDTGTLSAVAGPAATAAGKTLSCMTVTARLSCLLWSLDFTPIGNGDVADVTVPVSATATLSTDVISLSGALGASAAGVSITTSVFSGSINVFNPCDLNHDGLTDINDVSAVVAQATGSVACTTGDLTKDLKCNVLDVYREVLAALPTSSGVAGAGVCKTGP